MTSEQAMMFTEMDNALAAITTRWVAHLGKNQASGTFTVQLPIKELESYWRIVNEVCPRKRAAIKELGYQIGRELPSGCTEICALYTYSLSQVEALRDVFLAAGQRLGCYS